MVRAFTVMGEGTVYREQLCYFSDSERTYSYVHLSGIEGIEDYRASLDVTDNNDGGPTITMKATVTANEDRAVEAAVGTKAIFDKGIEALAKLAERVEVVDQKPTGNPGNSESSVVIQGAPSLSLLAKTKKGRTLCLFLHGIGGRKENWTQQLSCADPEMSVAALDLRGYGGSDLGHAQSTISDYCHDILRVKETFDAERLVLCGLSYGAWIATSFAIRYPDLLAGLVLSGGCTGMSEASVEEREAFRDSRDTPLASGLTPADFTLDVLKVIAGPHCDGETKEHLSNSMRQISVGTYRDALNCFTNPQERFDFSKLTMPVLLMTGEFDKLAPPSEIKSVAQRICEQAKTPDVRFEIITGAGHVCNVEQPEQYNRVLSEFLARLPK